jgi:hypothetical protein
MNVKTLCWVKQVLVSKDYVLYDSYHTVHTYIMVSEWTNYRGQEQISGCQETITGVALGGMRVNTKRKHKGVLLWCEIILYLDCDSGCMNLDMR